MFEVYEPQGLRFIDKSSGRAMLLVSEDERQESIRGWLCFRHPDGQWVTLRKATPADHASLDKAFDQLIDELTSVEEGNG